MLITVRPLSAILRTINVTPTSIEQYVDLGMFYCAWSAGTEHFTCDRGLCGGPRISTSLIRHRSQMKCGLGIVVS